MGVDWLGRLVSIQQKCHSLSLTQEILRGPWKQMDEGDGHRSNARRCFHRWGLGDRVRQASERGAGGMRKTSFDLAGWICQTERGREKSHGIARGGGGAHKTCFQCLQQLHACCNAYMELCSRRRQICCLLTLSLSSIQESDDAEYFLVFSVRLLYLLLTYWYDMFGLIHQ